MTFFKVFKVLSVLNDLKKQLNFVYFEGLVDYFVPG